MENKVESVFLNIPSSFVQKLLKKKRKIYSLLTNTEVKSLVLFFFVNTFTTSCISDEF